MAIRLIASDIDGTLLDSRWRLPEANRLAVETAVARGVEVALVTGRRFDFAVPIVRLFNCDLTLIVNNGALIKASDGRTMVRHLLPREVARRVLAVTLGYRDGSAVVFDRPEANQVIFERIDWEAVSHVRAYVQRNRSFVAEVSPLETCLTEDPIQLMFVGTVAAMRKLMAVLRAQSFAAEFAVAATEYESRDFSMVDVIAAGCSKGAAVAEWTRHRGLTAADVLAIGDNLNDLEMLRFARHRVVMGNAVPELQHFGWPTTLTSDEGGFAAAIEAYVLRDRPRAVGHEQ
jgi:Cof subfamily protein (haloacid dehalogenase superfamily)